MSDTVSKRWLPLEANPEVLTPYSIALGGTSQILYVDLLGMEDWAIDMLPSPVYSVLLLFRITPKTEQLRKEQEERIAKYGQKIAADLWYTKQLTANACGTVGIVHVLANIRGRFPLSPGSFLETFLERTKEMTPEERAKALDEDKNLEKAHAEAEVKGQSHINPDAKTEEHFVCFVESEGDIYEMDGRKAHPINHGPVNGRFVDSAVKIIRKSFMDLDPGEIRFSMIAVCGT